MMPAVCYICNKDLAPNEGGLIYFSEDEPDIQFSKNDLPGFADHASNAFWFCKLHYSEANKFSFLTKKEALMLLEAKFNKIKETNLEI